MASKPDTSSYERFSDVTDRLDEIVATVRDKGTSLERSLDLFDEAIALGTRAVDLVDKAAFSPEEREHLVDKSCQRDSPFVNLQKGQSLFQVWQVVLPHNLRSNQASRDCGSFAI